MNNNTPETSSGIVKVRGVIAYWLGILLTVFVVYTLATFAIQELQQLSIFFGLNKSDLCIGYEFKKNWSIFSNLIILTKIAFNFCICSLR